MDIRYIMLWKIVKVPDLKLPDAGHMQEGPLHRSTRVLVKKRQLVLLLQKL